MTCKRQILALAALALLGTLGSAVQAASAPYSGPARGFGQPRLGFVGRMLYGYGMKVEYVHLGSVAEQIGLEPGDVIVQVNGRPVSTSQEYFAALRFSGGQVRLLVDDCWGRGLIPVWAVLNGGSGPLREYSKKQ